MVTDSDKLSFVREASWHLAILPAHCPPGSWREVLESVGRQAPAKHPQTFKVSFPELAHGSQLYLKVFDQPRGLALFKNLFRRSKALRALHQGMALSKAGFDTPMIIAAGEQRRRLLLGRAFILSKAIKGETIPDYLAARNGFRGTKEKLNEKRKRLREVAQRIRRLHQLGFVHGDLVATNILISTEDELGMRIFLMDNDRTHRYPPWFPHWLWKRNLIQLNRMPLPGITLQDRMRFFRAYWANRAGDMRSRRFLKWLEMKTRKRRKECDAIESKGSFRRLMRWDPGRNGKASVWRGAQEDRESPGNEYRARP